MLYLLLANGFEEIEALGTVDFLRRCGIEVKMTSITGTRMVTGAHNIPVMADGIMRRGTIESSDGVILPGGMPGAETLRASTVIRRALKLLDATDKLIAAICAAPMVLGDCGLLTKRSATCYPGFEGWLQGATILKNANVVEDGNIITANGPSAMIPFATAIARRFVSDEKIEAVKRAMLFGE